MTISLIVPCHQNNQVTQQALASFAALDPAPLEIIAVIDGSNQELESAASELGFETITLPSRSGPSLARNAGALKAQGEILLFVDSDVVANQDLIARTESTFETHPQAVAVFGSYDDAPGDSKFLSQYKNLQHHFVHQMAHESASTFWTGCGAVRKKYFLEISGFSDAIHHPSMEDIEFGVRLKRAGHYIHLEKTMQVKHLKEYSALSLLRSDFIDRALPWSMLILQQGHMPNDLNVDWKNRLSVVCAYGFLSSLIASLATAKFLWLLPSVFCAVSLLALNHQFYHFLAKKRGALFLLKSLPWHWLYFLYCGLGFGCAFVYFHFRKFTSFLRRKRIADNSAYEHSSSP